MASETLVDAPVTWMRIMYLVAIVGAGVVGLMTVFTPRLAAQYIFAGSTSVDVYLRILGSLWLALGAVAVFGFIQPVTFSVVFVIQLIYKGVWVGVVALPAILTGNREPGLLFLTVLFALWIVGLLFAIPFQYLFAGV